MSEYVFFTDSTADLSPELAREMDAVVVPLTFTIDGRDYANYPDNRFLSSKEFYRMLREGENCTTAQISTAAFVDAFYPYLEQGMDILYIAFSNALSGTYRNGLLAAEELKRQFPNRTIRCIDSLQASMGEGLIAYMAARMRKAGQSLEEVACWVEENREHYCAWFTVDSLSYLHRGGRINATSALAGSLFGVKPILRVDEEGRLVEYEKVRGRKASLEALARKYSENAVAPDTQIVFISHGDCEEDAKALAQMIEEIGCKRVVIGDVGPVIGAHSGPGTLALFFRAENR